MAVVEAKKALVIMMILYGAVAIFGILAAVPMMLHVFPQSECILFSSYNQYPSEKLNYGHYASCNIVAYLFPVVILGAIFLWAKSWLELRRREGHAKAGKFEDQRVPISIMLIHMCLTALAGLLAIVVTSGYIVACENLHGFVSKNVQSKLNTNPYDTRGEEILTRYEDDYKFHRYTNRFGNAFGSDFYQISITCRSILTDPEIHQKLHDTHYEAQSRYYGYWYGEDLFAYDSQSEAIRTNSLVEASLAGSWLAMAGLLAGLVLMIIQRFILKKEAQEAERMSMHSTMMGGAHSLAGTYPRNGSVMSGSMRGSNFQRGGSLRGSDRSMKSTRRDIDDIALSMHHIGGSTGGWNQNLLGAAAVATPGGYGRKDIDDMVLNQHIAQHANYQPPSHYSSRETGYNSGTESSRFNRNQPDNQYYAREEVETEIF